MIPFNKPYMSGKEIAYITDAYKNGCLSGNGDFTHKCQDWLEASIGCQKAQLTHTGTHALELAALLAGIGPGDEVIMPSFTFVTTATAFVLRGAVPVFVDIRPDTLNLDESRIEAAITPRTKAIVPVHYAGVGCEMEVIMAIAKKHKLVVIEDAAHGLMAKYKGKPLGSFGSMAAVSFHETKNIISGEGGALFINEPSLCDRAEIIAEKGTNRKNFIKGVVNKYTWVDIGSSFFPSELIAAFLLAQIDNAVEITARRLNIWKRYQEAFKGLEQEGFVRRPIVPSHCFQNGHMYYLLFPDLRRRDKFITQMRTDGIGAVFHYIPLHSSPAGKKYAASGAQALPVTDSVSDCLVRLPLWVGLEDHLDSIIPKMISAIKGE